MDTRQLLSSLDQLEAKTIGVYAADCISEALERPAGIMDDYRKGGSHQLLYIDKQGIGT